MTCCLAAARSSLEVLRDHGCDEIQGYLISRPLPAADAVDWLRASAGSLNQAGRARRDEIALA
jgi:sensor c-di-GMP phosphodiesterase-like protein